MIKEPCAPQVGADVEGFLVHTEEGDIRPCVGVFDGTKDAPWRPENMPEGFAIQEDNVMVEFNVPPVEDSYAGADGIKLAKNMVKNEAATRGYYPLWNTPVHEFKPSQLTSKQAQNIGCDVDYDAYTGGKARTNVPNLTNWRSCGGHIHLGGDFKCPDFVAALFAELYLGVCGAGVTNTYRQEKNCRDQWYGLPGVFRSKTYGIEYRTPDNGWIRDGQTSEYTYSLALQCARWLTNTNAQVIQRAYRNIPWTKQRDFMINGDSLLRGQLLKQAREVGITI